MKHRGNDRLPLTLLQLQNFIKRDPPGYEYEFQLRYEHFKALLQTFLLKPQEYNQNLSDLVMFLSQVSACYKEYLVNFPQEIMDLLRNFTTVLDPTMRLGFCRALILMKNRGLVDATTLLSLCFELLRCQDKILRKYLQNYIIIDIKNMNVKHKNMKVNAALQNFMYQMLQDSNAVAVKVSLNVMIELYKKHVWRNTKTVNVIATACFSKVNKIMVTALKFFLGADEMEDKDSSESEDDSPNLREVMNMVKVTKKTRSRKKMLEKTKNMLKKNKKKKKKPQADFSALHLLHDPQDMAEKLLKKLESLHERYEIKLLMMNLISRLVGVHNLMLLNFYPHIQRFLQPHQRDVTQILAFAAQAAHELVPPDVISPVVKTIANNFISERNSVEVMTVGLNSVREICMRCPLSIEEDLLQDLTEYKSFKNKNVSMAAKSLIALFRRINPKLLIRKNRGKPTEATKELKPLNFGEISAKSYIPGAEVLPEVPDENSAEKDKLCYSSDDDACEISDDDDDQNDSNDDETSKQESSGNNSQVTDTDKSKHSETLSEHTSSNKEGDDKTEKATAVSVNRILSQEEFHKVKVAQLAKQVQAATGNKRKAADVDEETFERKEIVSLRDIERLHKKIRQNKESRLATVMEGREGREKFGRKKRKTEFQSKKQKIQNRNKAFMMIKHKVKAKIKRSFREKQLALRNALLKRRSKKK